MTTAPACGPLVVDLWLDDPPALVLEPRYLDRLRAINLRRACVMIDGTKPGLDVGPWNVASLALLAAALPGVERWITVWGEPTKLYVESIAHRMPALIAALGAGGVELDLEGPWKSTKVGGYRDLRWAGLAIVKACRDAGAKRVGVTTFTSALKRCLDAVNAADELALQVYAVAVTHDGKPVAYGGARGPERLPREELTRARAMIVASVELVAGLPAYRQTWPGVDPHTAMMLSVSSAVAAGCNTLRYWSSKHVCRLASKKYAAPVLASLGKT